MRRWSLVAVVVFFSASGCSSTEPDSATPLTRIDPAWVTGSAASHLQANGRFDLDFLLTEEAGDISLSAARTQAIAVLHMIAHSVGGLREFLEERHGGPLDFDRLVPCMRTMVQRYPWQIVGTGGVEYLRNAVGNFFWFQICTPDGQQAIWEVISGHSGVTIDSNGTLQYPSNHGNEFFSWGIPSNGEWELSPEVAIEALVQVVPRRVATIGEFGGCPVSISPCQGAIPLGAYVWHLIVESPIRVRRTSDLGELEVTDFYVGASSSPGARPEVLIPEAAQPADQWLPGPNASGPDSVLVHRRGPVLFSRITVIGR
jgi:hypothetical protein